MSLLAENTKRWNVKKIKSSFWPAAQKFAKRAVSHKADYEAISETIKNQTGKHVPWWFIPLVHERECVRGVDNWNCNIAQGDPFNQKSKHVPYNGPFHSFREAAIDALVHQAPKAADNTNWSGGGTMTIGEAYNGKKYANVGKPSPYVWSGTDQYVSGKVLVDHGPIEYTYPSGSNKGKPVVDTQLGIAISLKAMMELDETILLDGDMPSQASTPRKAETGVVAGGGTTGAATIKILGSYYILSWWDITGIILGTLAGITLLVYLINKHKKGQ